MSLRFALAGRLVALSAAAASYATVAYGQEELPGLASHFEQICGIKGEAGPRLPGDDVAVADAPGFFAGDLRRASESRVVKTGDRYAMRALVPSSFDPQHAMFLKCAVASGPASFAQEVESLSTMISAKARLGKTAQGFDYAQFTAGTTAFSVHSEPDGWVSIYRMDILMRNIDRKYLKKGAKPAPAPSVR